MYATFLQIVGLIGLTVAAVLEYGVNGGIAGMAVTAIYIGLAAERE